MIFVALIALMLWGIGWAMGARRAARWAALAALMALVIFLQLVLPAGHPIRAMTGGDARLWAMVAVFGALAAGYGWGVAALKRRARPHPLVAGATPEFAPAAPSVDSVFAPASPSRGGAAPAARPGRFSEAELARYARHMILKEIGGPGQRRLKEASVLVIGAGGLGAPALMYLAASGVGRIRLADDDVVEASNLQRQVIHSEATVGLNKAQSAAGVLRALNSHITVEPVAERFTPGNAAALLAGCDLALDGCDNFATRYAANAACAKAGVPLIGGALTQWEGQLSLWNPGAGGPCYQCIFAEAPAPGLVPTCAEAGVAAPLPGILGAMMAMEAIKYLTGAGETLQGRLMILDALSMESRLIRLASRADCPICGSQHV